MAGQVFPTKSNLISTRKSLDLAKLGYDLLDRKRNILVREMMLMIDKANEVQNRIDSTYTKAYASLQRANVTLGMLLLRAGRARGSEPCGGFSQRDGRGAADGIDRRDKRGYLLRPPFHQFHAG